MPSLDDTVKALMAFHTNNTNTPMVYELWNDGEITLTKGDDLYGQRLLHQIKPPLPRGLPLDCGLPLRFNNSRIIVETHDQATYCRELIRRYAEQD